MHAPFNLDQSNTYQYAVPACNGCRYIPGEDLTTALQLLKKRMTGDPDDFLRKNMACRKAILKQVLIVSLPLAACIYADLAPTALCDQPLPVDSDTFACVVPVGICHTVWLARHTFEGEQTTKVMRISCHD